METVENMATMTAAQKRAQEKIHYDAFLRDCPSRQLLDCIGSRWVTLVLVTLSDGSRRYSEIRAEIPGVSEKMLTQTLRTLERDGLIFRTVTPTVPVRTDYELTDLGRTLLGPIRALKSWAEENMPLISRAREVYDSRDSRAT